MDHTNGAPNLGDKERARMFPPRRVYEDLVDKAVLVWKGLPRSLQIPDLTPEKMADLVQQARKAQQEELNTKLLLKEQRDVRIRSDHEAYRALRTFRRVVKALAKDDAVFADAFGFLIEAFAASKVKASQPSPTQPPAA